MISETCLLGREIKADHTLMVDTEITNVNIIGEVWKVTLANGFVLKFLEADIKHLLNGAKMQGFMLVEKGD